MRLDVPFGDGTLTFDTPAGLEVECPTGKEFPEQEPLTAARFALNAPTASPPLHSKARGAADAVIAVPDATRGFPTAAILPPLLDALEKGGIPASAVTVVAALGLHRPLSEEERAATMGLAAGRGVRFAEHDPRGNLRDFGKSAAGAPLLVNERVASAGFLLSIGLVEPHQYAGYSGGWKTVGIGCAGEATIAWTHAPRFIDSPRCRPGLADRNPFNDVVKENARRAGLRFVLNFVPGRGGGVVAAAAGDPGVVHRLLGNRAKEAFSLPVRNQADVAVAGVGAPKDANLYQATRAATNLVYSPFEAVRPGGTIIIPAPCPEGVGTGTGEKRFAAALQGGPEGILADRKRELLAGEQRAYMVARVLSSRKVVIVGSSIPPGELAAMGLGAAATVEEALRQAVAAGARRLLVVPRALRALLVPFRSIQ